MAKTEVKPTLVSKVRIYKRKLFIIFNGSLLMTDYYIRISFDSLLAVFTKLWK